MTARAALRIASALAMVVVVAGCTSFYEVPIETPIQPKLDVASFQRVLVAGFISGGTDELDANLETVRLLRSQLRTKSRLRVIEADVLPLMDVAANNGATRPPKRPPRHRPPKAARNCPSAYGTRRTSPPTSACSPTSTTGSGSARSSRTR